MGPPQHFIAGVTGKLGCGMSTGCFRRRNPLGPSGGLSYCVEEITYEVRLDGFAKHSARLAYKRPIGHYTLLAITGTAKPPQTLLFFLS
jgi:hypothetical protein